MISGVRINFQKYAQTNRLRICTVRVARTIYLLWNLYLRSSAATTSRRRMYFDLASRPDKRNFSWGNICLEQKRTREKKMRKPDLVISIGDHRPRSEGEKWSQLLSATAAIQGWPKICVDVKYVSKNWCVFGRQLDFCPLVVVSVVVLDPTLQVSWEERKIFTKNIDSKASISTFVLLSNTNEMKCVIKVSKFV